MRTLKILSFPFFPPEVEPKSYMDIVKSIKFTSFFFDYKNLRLHLLNSFLLIWFARKNWSGSGKHTVVALVENAGVKKSAG